MRNVDLNDKETQLFCFIGKYPNLDVDSLPGRHGLRGIYRNEMSNLVRDLERKQVIFCTESNKLDMKNAWKYQMRGNAPYKKVKTCTLSRLGSRIFKDTCK